jgi:hypothetical protein
VAKGAGLIFKAAALPTEPGGRRYDAVPDYKEDAA